MDQNGGPSADSAQACRSRFPTFRLLAMPLAIMALGPVWLMVLSGLLESGRARWWGTLLAWRMGPYGRFPFPFEAQTFEGSTSDVDYGLLGLIVTMLLLSVVTLTALHAALFRAVFGALRYVGWPRYVVNVRPRLDLVQIWRRSVLRAWWVIPLLLSLGRGSRSGRCMRCTSQSTRSGRFTRLFWRLDWGCTLK